MRPRLRYVLAALFIIVATVPVLLLGAWVEKEALRNEFNSVSEKHLLLARNVVVALERFTSDTRGAFRYFIETADEKRGSNAAVVKMARQLGFRHFCLVDDHGKIIYQFGGEGELPRIFPPAIMDKLRPQIAAAGVTFSDVIPDRLKRPTIYLTQRIALDVLAIGALETNHIVQLQKSIIFGRRGHAAIVDRRGNIIAHPNAAWVAQIKNISDLKPVQRMMDQTTGVITFFSPALNQDVITGYTTVPGVGWGVMVPQPTKELEERAHEVQHVGQIIIAVGLVAAAMISWLLSGLLVRPIESVISAARELADGNAGVRVPTYSKFIPEEFQELGTGFNAMARDVSSHLAERKRVVETLRESEARFRAVVENAGDALFLVDPSGEIVDVNHAACNALGYTRQELLDLSVCDIDADLDAEKSVVLMNTLRAGSPVTVESNYRRKTGTTFPVEIRIVLLELGPRKLMLALARDMTDRKQDLQKLLQAQKMESLGNLAGGIAHNLNNILQPILTLSQLTLNNLSEGQDKDNLNKVVLASGRAKDLVTQILSFSRQETMQREFIDIYAVVNEALELLRSSLPASIEIKEQLDQDTGTVFADAAQTETVLINLISNSVDSMENSNGVLNVSLSRVSADETLIRRVPGLEIGRYAKISIADTGKGMKEETVKQIFDPFFTTKELGRGTGLGLSSAYGIVSSHDGAISVFSQPGIGTTIDAYLPLVERPAGG